MASISERGSRVLMTNYKQLPIAFVHGEGCVLTDADGREYVDFLAGIAVCNLGYGNKAVSDALHTQVDSLLHSSNLVWIEPQIRLAELLTAHSFADRVFFCNSGAEANESAIKLARRYQFEKGNETKRRILAARGSFHGRSLTTLSVTDNATYRQGFGPMPDGFAFIDFNDPAACEAIDDTVAAVIVEPVQGEGGVTPADPAYLAALRNRCDETGALLIFDEIQCGMGRTGTLFAYESTGVTPDIVTLAKALGNGVPIGALLAREDVAAAFTPGTHGTTFGGNHLCTAAGAAVVEEMLRLDLPARAQATGAYFREKLDSLTDLPGVVGVRGKGLMLGLVLDYKAAPIVSAMLEKGFIINATADTVLRFLPPLIVETKQIDALVEALREVLSQRSN